MGGLDLVLDLQHLLGNPVATLGDTLVQSQHPVLLSFATQCLEMFHLGRLGCFIILLFFYPLFLREIELCLRILPHWIVHVHQHALSAE